MWKCPNSKLHDVFIATAHVTEDWEIDNNGEFLGKDDSECEVLHRPSEGDVVTCSICGEEAIWISDKTNKTQEEIIFEMNLYELKSSLLDEQRHLRRFLHYNKNDGSDLSIEILHSSELISKLETMIRHYDRKNRPYKVYSTDNHLVFSHRLDSFEKIKNLQARLDLYPGSKFSDLELKDSVPHIKTNMVTFEHLLHQLGTGEANELVLSDLDLEYFTVHKVREISWKEDGPFGKFDETVSVLGVTYVRVHEGIAALPYRTASVEEGDSYEKFALPLAYIADEDELHDVLSELEIDVTTFKLLTL